MANQVGKVLGLFISQKNNLQRTQMQSILVDKIGVIGDKFYGKDTQRAILLTSIDSYNLAKEHNIEVPFGYLGENILIDFNPYKFSHTTQIKIGDAILQISQNCTICNHLSAIDKRLPKLLKNDRGIFATAINNATININDKIYIIN